MPSTAVTAEYFK